MIISPPFFPTRAAAAHAHEDDPLMAAVDDYVQRQGIYPIAFDRRTHTGTHVTPAFQGEPVRAIADGEVVAYRVTNKPLPDHPKATEGNSNNGFVLLKHTTETGEGRTLTFYSLYMHLLDLQAQNSVARPTSPAPAQQRPDSSPDQLPAWLLTATPGSAEGVVVQGLGKKVSRKDLLGHTGACHGNKHLHLEIFMTEADFDAYFAPGKTQLGERTPRTAATVDVWGHTYYVIPGGSRFQAAPTDYDPDADHFPPLQEGQLDPAHTLHVEAYFHQGQRYIRSWLDRGNGHRVPLNGGEPVCDGRDYEYTLYQRATRYYPKCPSDGYELLRFGRILSHPATLPEPEVPLSAFELLMAGRPRRYGPPLNPRATWVAVDYDEGQRGYIDLSNDSIQILSDADFPLQAGWQKIAEGNTPFGDDGLCDYPALLPFVGDGSDPHDEWPEAAPTAHDERLRTCLRREASVRDALRGFVCHAPSEWDGSLNRTRFRSLNEPGGFFAERKDTDPDGFEHFLAFLAKLQFMEACGFAGGQKFWFFEPLKFIRHFRRCGWLSEQELISLLPPSAIRYVKAPDKPGYWVSDPVILHKDNRPVIQGTRVELNKAMRKFGIAPSPWRMAAFLANAMQETQWFATLHEGGANARYSPWEGRGFLQLTWPYNYIKYWAFLGREIPAELKSALDDAAKQANQTGSNAPLQDARFPLLTEQMIQWRDQLQNAEYPDPSRSAGAYWAWSGAMRFADEVPQLRRMTQFVMKPDNRLHAYYSCESFGKVAATVNVGSVRKDAASIARVIGLVARYQAYASALVVLADPVAFPRERDKAQEWPEGYQRRKKP